MMYRLTCFLGMLQFAESIGMSQFFHDDDFVLNFTDSHGEVGRESFGDKQKEGFFRAKKRRRLKGFKVWMFNQASSNSISCLSSVCFVQLSSSSFCEFSSL